MQSFKIYNLDSINNVLQPNTTILPEFLQNTKGTPVLKTLPVSISNTNVIHSNLNQVKSASIPIKHLGELFFYKTLEISETDTLQIRSVDGKVLPTVNHGHIVIKYNQVGETVKTTVFETSDYVPNPSNILYDHQEECIYVYGVYLGGIIDPSTNTLLTSPGSSPQLYISRLDLNLNCIWTKTLNSKSSTYITEIKLLEESLVITGTTHSDPIQEMTDFNGDKYTKNRPYPSNTSFPNIFVARLEKAAGTQIWIKTAGRTQQNAGEVVIWCGPLDSTDRVVCGFSIGSGNTTYYDFDDVAFETKQFEELVLTCLDYTDGTVVWSKYISGSTTAQSSYNRFIKIWSDGNTIWVGGLAEDGATDFDGNIISRFPGLSTQIDGAEVVSPFVTALDGSVGAALWYKRMFSFLSFNDTTKFYNTEDTILVLTTVVMLTPEIEEVIDESGSPFPPGTRFLDFEGKNIPLLPTWKEGDSKAQFGEFDLITLSLNAQDGTQTGYSIAGGWFGKQENLSYAMIDDKSTAYIGFSVYEPDFFQDFNGDIYDIAPESILTVIMAIDILTRKQKWLRSFTSYSLSDGVQVDSLGLLPDPTGNIITFGQSVVGKITDSARDDDIKETFLPWLDITRLPEPKIYGGLIPQSRNNILLTLKENIISLGILKNNVGGVYSKGEIVPISVFKDLPLPLPTNLPNGIWWEVDSNHPNGGSWRYDKVGFKIGTILPVGSGGILLE